MLKVGAFLITFGLGAAIASLMLGWFVRHEVYFAPTLTKEARALPAETARVAQHQVASFAVRWVLPVAILMAVAGLVLMVLA